MKLFILTSFLFIISVSLFCQVQINDGVDAYNKGDYQRASIIFENILRQNPKSEVAYQYLAQTYIALKKNVKAIEILQNAVKYFPNNNDFHLLLGKLYAEQKSYNKAEQSLLTALKIKSEDVETKKILAIVYFNLGTEQYYKKNFERAKNYFLKSLQFDSLYENSYINTAGILLEQKKYADAKAILHKGLNKFNDNDKMLKLLSEVYVQENNFIKAAEIYEEMYKKNPNDLDIGLNLALLYRYANKVDAALSLYDTLISRFPKKRKVYEAVIDYWKLFNRQDKIREVYQRMETAFPDDIDLKFQIAVTYLKEKKYEDARKVYFQILKQDSINLKAYIEIAKLYELEENPDSAIYYLDKALLIDNRDFDALSLKGNILKKQKQYDKALGVFRILKRYYEELPISYIQIGDIYYDVGEYDSANYYYHNALNLDPKNSTLYYKIAKIYESQSDNTNADKYYRKSLEMSIKQFDLVQKKIEKTFANEKLTLDDFDKLSPVQTEVEEINLIIDESLKYFKNNYNFSEFKNLIDEYYSKYPMSIMLLLYKAENYEKEGKLDSAFVVIKRILSVNPNQEEAHLKMGNLYERLNDLDNAKIAYLRLLKSDKYFTTAFDNLIRISQQQNKLDELCDQVLELYSYNRGNTLLRERLIEILHKANRVSEARKIIESK